MDLSSLVWKMRKIIPHLCCLLARVSLIPFKVNLYNDCMSIPRSKLNLTLKADSFLLVALSVMTCQEV